jgi:hypothetical protein
MRDAEESDDFLYASLLFHEINAENLSDEDTELIEEKVDENCPKVDEVVMDIGDILEQLAFANIDNEKISKFNIHAAVIFAMVFFEEWLESLSLQTRSYHGWSVNFNGSSSCWSRSSLF